MIANSPRPVTAGALLPVRPVALERISCGFPSPAQDYATDELDPRDLLVRDAVSTFYVSVEGHSMIDAGLDDGDIAVVDRGITPVNGMVVVAVVDGQQMIKRLITDGDDVRLHPENPEYPDLLVTDAMDARIWGVVTWALHRMK
ncbi:translesion error-prone DNA polymerase V autoproteolytic subunit [Kocuria coralli]|uniref:Translesion error-prone DNA polymerase V autoproteolytic subunit n=1 Tax=Kocuria coralli TaxID=1461025 RepID=A0A5J5KTE5_9MICC|nr:translesion error-prone DNA polymerase V autoproteolytic subunit [Kocuria coralli]KAA9392999.1 translesion error-prone DNA polymerase V autoproteolytic subunit [Kocuria coralli]